MSLQWAGLSFLNDPTSVDTTLIHSVLSVDGWMDDRHTQTHIQKNTRSALKSQRLWFHTVLQPNLTFNGAGSLLKRWPDRVYWLCPEREVWERDTEPHTTLCWCLQQLCQISVAPLPKPNLNPTCALQQVLIRKRRTALCGHDKKWTQI